MILDQKLGQKDISCLKIKRIKSHDRTESLPLLRGIMPHFKHMAQSSLVSRCQ